MAEGYGVTDKGMGVFRRVVGDLDRMLGRYRLLLEQGANEIENPLESAKRLQWIVEQIDKMQKSPYLPFMRFGNYTLTVRDAAGTEDHFETFVSRRVRECVHEEVKGPFPSDDHFSSGLLT